MICMQLQCSCYSVCMCAFFGPDFYYILGPIVVIEWLGMKKVPVLCQSLGTFLFFGFIIIWVHLLLVIKGRNKFQQ